MIACHQYANWFLNVAMTMLLRYIKAALPCIFVSSIVACFIIMLLVNRYMPNIERISHDHDSDELTYNRKEVSNVIGHSKLLKVRFQAKTNFSKIQELRRLSEEVSLLNHELLKIHNDVVLLKQEKANQEFIAHLEIISNIRKMDKRAYADSSSNNDIHSENNNFESYKERNISDREQFYSTQLNNEFEVVPFTRFTLQRLYLVDPGLGKRVVEKPIGYKRSEINEILQHALNFLNSGTRFEAGLRVLETAYVKEINANPDFSQRELQKSLKNESFITNTLDKNTTKTDVAKKVFGIKNFLEGIYRNLPTVGTLYELYFRAGNAVEMENGYRFENQNIMDRGYLKVVIRRPYSRQLNISAELLPNVPKTIEIIIALSGRVAAFRRFMNRYVQVCIVADGNIRLTVVYFGSEGYSAVQAIMHAIEIKFRHNTMRLVHVDRPFSRGEGLKLGAKRLNISMNTKDEELKSNTLLFLCDVDVIFTNDFLERCRLNAEYGRKVYYPIVFSLYNPEIVDSLKEEVESSSVLREERDHDYEQITLSRETGFWRDFGYGMTCQYRDDFLRFATAPVGRGFRSTMPSKGSAFGWGLEDVTLFRRQVQSEMFVVRATDPGIFHVWHPKRCDLQLPEAQYRSCVRSKALNEASHAQLGMLAFRQEILAHRKLVY